MIQSVACPNTRSTRGRRVCVRRDHEAIGNEKPGPDELAEICAFTAGDGEVLRADRGERSSLREPGRGAAAWRTTLRRAGREVAEK
jgi:hypothetical protein